MDIPDKIVRIEITYTYESGNKTIATHIFEPPITDPIDDKLSEAEDILLGHTLSYRYLPEGTLNPVVDN